MLTKVKETIEKYSLLKQGDRVLVGFSGGIDSVCLLHVLHCLTEYKLELIALYVNHSLRPAENIHENELLKQYGEKLSITVVERVIDIPGRLKAKPQSLQLLAREERYRIFREVFKEVEATKIALAHHKDDQAETIFYRLIRGTGLDGLAGIPKLRDGIFIRPFLGVSRAEIRKYVDANQLPWVEDSSNHKLIYRRNQIRHQLIPQIETDFNPRFKEALVRLGKQAEEYGDFMENLIEGYCLEMLIYKEAEIGLKLAAFLNLHSHLQYYLLKRIFSRFGPDYHLTTYNIYRLRNKIMSESYNFKMIHMYKEIVVFLEEGMIWFEKKNQTEGERLDLNYSIQAPGTSEIRQIGLQLQIISSQKPTDWKKVSKNQVYLDSALLKQPLKIRFWRPGDVFKPLGANGNQKLQDFFINEKINRRLRGKIPILTTADDRIVWIIGYRLSDDFKVSNQSDAIWQITAQKTTIATGED